MNETQPMTQAQTSPSDVSNSSLSEDLSSIGTLLHSLSNKLLPVVIFSELALRRCDESQLKSQIEKIHSAAEQARDLLIEIRTLYAKIEP